MLHFATFFDVNYLSRGLALLHSLRQHSSEHFTLYVLAIDGQVKDYFDGKGYGDVCVFPLRDVEEKYPELLQAKQNRSIVEYYFTLSPYLPLYVLGRYENVKQITSLDADIFFFADPAPVFRHYQQASVLITPHNFSPPIVHLEAYGKYNVSFQSFKRDSNALACLEVWRKNCLDWCHDYPDAENKRYADQQYLDTWKEQFAGVEEITLPGTGVAPWNIGDATIEQNAGKFYVNGSCLIYFHFHGLRIFKNYFAQAGLEGYQAGSTGKGIKLMYHSYLKVLRSLMVLLDDSGYHVKRNAVEKQNALKRLIMTNGYWLYNSSVILNVNIYRHLKAIMNKLRFNGAAN